MRAYDGLNARVSIPFQVVDILRRYKKCKEGDNRNGPSRVMEPVNLTHHKKVDHAITVLYSQKIVRNGPSYARYTGKQVRLPVGHPCADNATEN